MLDSNCGSSRAAVPIVDPRQRAGEPLADLADRLDGARVRRLHPAVLLRVGVGEDRDRVAQVVEGEDHVGEHQRHVRQPDHVRVGLREALDRAHAVVAEEADRAARERNPARPAVDRRLAVARDLALGELVGVAAVGEAPAHDVARLVADERPAADALALLGGLEQERRAGAAQLQERGDRRLAVLDEGVADRDQVVLAGERARLLDARRDLQLRQRRRASSTLSASASSSPRVRSSTVRW